MSARCPEPKVPDPPAPWPELLSPRKRLLTPSCRVPTSTTRYAGTRGAGAGAPAGRLIGPWAARGNATESSASAAVALTRARILDCLSTASAERRKRRAKAAGRQINHIGDASSGLARAIESFVRYFDNRLRPAGGARPVRQPRSVIDVLCSKRPHGR